MGRFEKEKMTSLTFCHGAEYEPIAQLMTANWEIVSTWHENTSYSKAESPYGNLRKIQNPHA